MVFVHARVFTKYDEGAQDELESIGRQALQPVLPIGQREDMEQDKPRAQITGQSDSVQ
jgi:hypothetical protein